MSGARAEKSVSRQQKVWAGRGGGGGAGIATDRAQAGVIWARRRAAAAPPPRRRRRSYPAPPGASPRPAARAKKSREGAW
jgi:hypothetical protein